MFSGMGTARLGFEQVGHTCVYSIEYDKHKRQIYKAVFGNVPEGEDIKFAKGSDLPRADCWIAGFPCQDISVAGKQLGFGGERSSLFFEVMRLLQETKEENKPSYLLFENVKNFFSVSNGRDFLEALYQMDAHGYNAEWALLNSKHHGVPQNRERVFLIGHLRGRRTRKVFPLRSTDTAIGADINILAHRNGYRRNSQVYDVNGGIECLDTCGGGGRHPHIAIQINRGVLQEKEDNICSCLDANYYKGLDNHAARTGIKVVGRINSSQDGFVFDTNGISQCLSAGHGNMPKVEIRAVLTSDRAKKRQNSRRIKEDGEPMFTLTGQDRHGIQLQNRIRRLTPRECFRLQAVPEYIIDKIIDENLRHAHSRLKS
jgi:DNA (cytosine-5)-methyltransferase 1